MMRTHVAVLGAGLAGLHAARLLRAANVEFMLLEARGRLGGRILTVDDVGQPADDGFNLGPPGTGRRCSCAGRSARCA